jgi:hypothetical protein
MHGEIMTANDLYMVAILTIITILTVSLVYFSSRKREDHLKLQAEKRGGEIRKGGLFKWTELVIPFQGVQVVIHSEPGGKNRPPKTAAQVTLDTPRLPTIRIIRYGLWQKLLVRFGKERLLSGDDDFDGQWMVEADDPFFVQKLVTAELKYKLAERSLRSIDIQIEPQKATISIPSVPSNEAGYDYFIDTVMLILQRVL